MAILALVETWEGAFKKTSYETVSYGKQIGQENGTEVTALTFGSNDPSMLSNYGADTIINVSNIDVEKASNQVLAQISSDLIKEKNIETIIISNTNFGKSIAPLIAQMLNSGLLSNAIDYPESYSPLTVKCKAFSGKAHATYQSSNQKNIITILPSSIGEIQEKKGRGELIQIESATDHINNKIKIKSRHKSMEKIPLPEAEIVISAGRGLKSSDNWGMIEELAELLGAATACSKPVSDMGWRPHSEHVGQTGIAINPKLYIAIGISGAIQHLAGVSGSKNIVVINTDPEAPFFKAANYGIIGDAFNVVPQLIEAVKKHNN